MDRDSTVSGHAHDEAVGQTAAESSHPTSTSTSGPPSRQTSSSTLGGGGGSGGVGRGRPHVRFTLGGSSPDDTDQQSIFEIGDESADELVLRPRPTPRASHPRSTDGGERRTLHASSGSSRSSTPERESDAPASGPWPLSASRPRSSLTRIHNYSPEVGAISEEGGLEADHGQAQSSSGSARQRPQVFSRQRGTHPAPVLPGASPASSPSLEPAHGLSVKLNDIPLVDMDRKLVDSGEQEEVGSDEEAERKRRRGRSTSDAHQLVRMHSRKEATPDRQDDRAPPGLRSDVVTPIEERDPDDYVPPPEKYRGGILSALLKLYGGPGGYAGGMPSGPGINPTQLRRGSGETSRGSPNRGAAATPGSSGHETPRTKHQKWYNKSANHSTSSLAGLVESSSVLAAPAAAAGLGGQLPDPQLKPGHRRRPPPGGRIGAAIDRMSRPRLEDEIRITVHIAETMSRQRYMVKLCRALMSFGAPTHRLEEYMKMTARVLEIDGQFLYLPGCMIISFDDASTHTTEVKLVRSAQGVDLGKLRDTHEIYKEVVHDIVGMEEATQRLDEVMKRKQKHPPWVLVLVYGLASATVGPFAFQARLVDLPMAFVLGSLLGILQLIVAPKSDLYSNVFEISAAVLTSFLARALGSIRGGDVFCFSALAQSSIALILPGYVVLCGSLELQSKNIVAGSVRMVYAIIYSLFLGFGITIGTAVFGLFDEHATSDTTCKNQLPQYYRFLFVPPFTLCLVIINQAKWKQAPVMIIIAFAGYVVNFFSSKKFKSNAQIANTLGAFAVGVLGNLYSRLHHGVAAAALLPAIFVQVPSGLAASGSLVSGVTSANQIVRDANATTKTTVQSGSDTSQLNTVVFNVGYSMIQVAIGITVGLFLSALIIYPFGKRRSGLFSF